MFIYLWAQCKSKTVSLTTGWGWREIRLFRFNFLPAPQLPPSLSDDAQLSYITDTLTLQNADAGNALRGYRRGNLQSQCTLYLTASITRESAH